MSKRRKENSARRIAADCLAVRVRMLSRAVTGIYDEALRPAGIRVSQLNLLVHVAANDGVGQSQVGRELCMEKSTLSRNVERMVQQGWLDVWSGEDDRSQGLGVTARGKRLIERAYPMWAKGQRKAKTVLGGPGAVAVGRMVRRLGAPGGGK